jgi:diguanylate cyclase (GGDEF)-like protein
MYLPHLMLGYAAATLLVLIGCRVTARGVPGLAGVQMLSWGLVASLVGMLFISLRAVTPLWVAIVLANLAIFVYSVLFYAALIQCLGARSRIAIWGTGLLLADLAGNLYFTYVEPSLSARILVANLLPVVCNIASAALLFRARVVPVQSDSRNAGRRYLIGALAWLQVVDALAAVARCVLTVLYPPEDIMHVDLIQVAGSYSYLLLNLGAGAGLLGLAFWLQREELYARANTDGLTGLLNRRAFDEILIRELRRAHRLAHPLPVMMADIDFFKRVNDSLGHQAGDEVLRHVANTLRRTLRPADVLCRFGGEEFAILLRESKPNQAADIAERLRTGVASIPDLPGGVRVTISIGLAISRPGESPEGLIARGDQAMYRSKREGRNRVSISADTGDCDPSEIQAAPRLVQGSDTPKSA